MSNPPNPPAAPEPKPLSFAFPFRAADGKILVDEHTFYEWLGSENTGNFAVSGSGMWHGGIHVSANGAGQHLDLAHGARGIAAGEIIAYRMNRAPLTGQIAADSDKPAQTDNDSSAFITGRYSSAFTLVRHTLEYPAGNRLTFFSLYMHLQSVAEYEQKGMQPPAYWARAHEVTEYASDKPKATANIPTPVEHIGLNIRDQPGHGTILGILPCGARVRIGEKRKKGLWGKIEAIESGTILPPEVASYVRDGADRGWVYLGKEHGHLLLKPIISQALSDRVVALATPIRINAGDLIGHLGHYWQSDAPEQEHRMVHIEVFCGGDLPDFLARSRAAAKDIVDLSKLPLLHIDKGVKLFQIKKADAQGNPVYEEGADAPQTAVVQTYSQAALDAFPAEHKGPKDNGPGPGQPWWYVTSANSRHEDISGWVRNRQMPPNGGVMRQSPHAWIDFETVTGGDGGNPTMCRTVDGYLDYALNEDKPATGDIQNLKPLACNFYRALSPMRNEARAADELRALRDNKWLRFRASRLMLKHRSEWASQSEYESFFETVLKRIDEEPYHKAEIERLKKLVWWDEVSAKVGQPFPSSPEVFHIHPVALAGNFHKGGFQFTLPMLQKLFPQASSNALQEVANELNSHLEIYKLDTPLRRMHFFAQIKQETGPSLSREEGFVWKASSLISSFSYFHNHPDQAHAHGYHQVKPIKANGTAMNQADFEAIANGAYGGRAELGNGSYASGDGWRFRGRGLKQLTGRANYKSFTKWHSAHQNEWPQEIINFELNPELLVQPKYAARSAAFFWVDHNLHIEAEKGATPAQVNAITAIVNLHTDSYAARVDNFNEIYSYGDFN